MIRVVASQSATAAKAYFTSGLAKADYYADEILGKWHGLAAKDLGLEGEVSRKSFVALCDNRHPFTGEQLTPRQRSERIVGWDINFHAPKSLSLVQAFTRDARLVDAFRESVAETMAEMESQIATRVRIHGQYKDRLTGNGTWSEFVHFTSRPIGGIPDPHLHVHAYLFNSTFDSIEGRWKAAKIRDLKRDMPLHQAKFHARLALKIKALGYDIKRTRQNWEIAEIPRPLIEKFSRRSRTIEELAQELQITDPKLKDQLGALSREGKRHGLSQTQLLEAWGIRLSPEEISQLKEACQAKNSNHLASPSPAEALDHAIEKCFARESAIRKNQLLAEALRFGVGNVSPNQIANEYRKRQFWEQNYSGETFCTYQSVLAEEVALMGLVRGGKDRFAPMKPKDYRLEREYLSEEQQSAVHHLLNSRDKVIAVRGGAGTGKTTAMQEAVEAIEIGGKKVFALAPSADASRDTLRKAGFKNAETVAHFIANPAMHRQAQGQVVWVDEAGLLGTRELWALLDAAGPDTRIILTGDTRQHGPVARGDAFRLMQQYAGLKPAEITEIRRQKPETYKAAVSALSHADLKNAFLHLDAMGSIREYPNVEERYSKLANDYLTLSKGKTAPLVVSPTRNESRQVTLAIRSALRESGKLGNGREFIRYRNLFWETAERREPENYRPGLMIQYHQNLKGIKRGEKLQVHTVTENGEILLRSESGSERPLDFATADKFQVYAKEKIELAEGDRIRLTRNGFSKDGRRHSNGNLREIRGFTASGDIQLTTGAVIDKTDGHLDYGYCQTSHSSQSKSVKDVLIAQSSDSFAASSREQFYVSVSRGKERVFIYTDDRIALQEAVGISGAKRSALELARDTHRQWSELIEKELNSKQWREKIAKKGARRAAGEFLEQLNRRKEQTIPDSSQKKPRVWPDAVKQHRQAASTKNLTPPTTSVTKQRDRISSATSWQNSRPLARAFGRVLQAVSRANLWQKPGQLLRESRHQIRKLRDHRRERLKKHFSTKKPQAKPSLRPTKPVKVMPPAPVRK